VLALRYIKLRRDAGHDAPWLDQLPASTVELVASDGGLLAFLEHAHGSQMIKCLSTSLISFPALCCFDICRLCEVDGVEITKESASNALDVLQSCGLTEAFFFPSIPGRQVCAVHSKEVTRGLRDRYCIAEQKDLQFARGCLVASWHIAFETDSQRLRRLLDSLSHMPPSTRMNDVRSLLDSEDAVILETDFRYGCCTLSHRCAHISPGLTGVVPVF
jgi:hypothetical protein